MVPAEEANKSQPIDPDLDDAARVQHLTAIQGIISRMSGSGFQIKGFAIAIAVAAVGSAQHLAMKLGALAVVGLMFADAYYLGLERAYRRLYDEVVEDRRRVHRGEEPVVASFSMDFRPFVVDESLWRVVSKRRTIHLFYGVIAVALLVSSF